jgi:FlaA1/EpsC-like NDP-sugar epimerase
MPNKEDIIKIHNQAISFEELFNKKIDYSCKEFSYLDDKIVLVTGGGGSIGSVLLQRLLENKCKKIIILDHSEYAIFKIKLKFKNEIENNRLHLFLGDIRNKELLEKIFDLFPIQIIYHAAAYKHIDILENNTDESLSVNIKATINLLEIAINNYATEQFIFISTDKAVNPINVMGISKRIAELYLLKKVLKGENSCTIKIKIIRFGNVFNSSGSVFTIFKYQIENQLPITITNRNMKRFFISKYQASKGLVEIASPTNYSGIFIIDMGNSFNIDILLNTFLKKLNLNFVPKIAYLDSIPTFEKFEEELYFPFEKIEKNISTCKKINLNNYNMRNIEREITNLMQLIKK